MHRAFVEHGMWRVAVNAVCDASQQKQATLRVSALAGIAVLGLMMVPDIQRETPVTTPAQIILSTAPEIIPAKSIERVPGGQTQVTDDVTSAATVRRWRSLVASGAITAESIATARPAPHAAIEVVDPTTLRAGEMVVRLAGVISPPGNTTCRRLDGLAVPCADRAISYLQLLVKGRAVACSRAGLAPDGVEKGQCRIGESDIAEQMVRQGWAKAEDQPEERFLLAEAAARKQKLGIWR